MSSYWVLLTADWHLGSAFAVWPPNFVGSCGTTLKINRGQCYLYNNIHILYKEIRSITGGKIDVAVFDGDAIQGKNKKGDGEYIVEQDLTFQGRAFIEMVSPILDMSRERLVFRGSRYHVGNNAETEEWIGREIDSVQDDFGHHCWMWMPEYVIGPASLDIAHHQSAVMINRSMPLERERRFSNQVGSLKRNPTAIIRAHGHVQVELLVDGDLQIGLCPIQLQSDYCKMSKVPNRLLSRKLGVCLLEIDRKVSVRNPIRVHWLTFDHPPLSKRSYMEGEKWQRSLLSRILT